MALATGTVADGGPNVVNGRVVIITACSIFKVVWLVEQRLVTKPHSAVILVVSSVDRVPLA